MCSCGSFLLAVTCQVWLHGCFSLHFAGTCLTPVVLQLSFFWACLLFLSESTDALFQQAMVYGTHRENSSCT